ncbi:hypothetical protein K431DRAFT_346592 [Polychaeton citri CBS 116435]|uniref:Zn(2)-C6 fungal-type domain-containing protein n=1 Tax=Polychaeton citri CBS 116435 TaxID=1314669 RepID=A0A9P4QAH9_9PEZI|nr:hypothetical protein K431DRAFT_346592 [Polychaeton citri CBS 116435]
MDEVQPFWHKACTKCHARKIKCDGQLPCCTNCKKTPDDCDITERIAYSYATVEDLVKQVQELKEQLGDAQRSYTRATLPPDLTTAFVNERRHDVESQLQHSGVEVETSYPTLHQVSISEELGFLSMGHPINGAQVYIGSATGSRFSKIFFKTLGSPLSNLLALHSSPEANVPTGIMHDLTCTAGLPPERAANALFSSFISKIHSWWPVICLSDLRAILRDIYVRRSGASAYYKFVAYMVFALGHNDLSVSESAVLQTMHTGSEYFATALQFYGGFHGLQNMVATCLMSIWCMHSSNPVDHADLWHMCRFTISIGIELGCHRSGKDWALNAHEIESRNRAWWCAYGLERTVAVALGRTLAIRNQAIDAEFPSAVEEDVLDAPQARMCPTLNVAGVKPAIHMFKLSAIEGDILQSVYIARPRSSLSPQALHGLSQNLQQRLAAWAEGLNEFAIPEDTLLISMKLRHALAVMLLNRPSPVFPQPDETALQSCYQASRTALQSWMSLRRDRILLQVRWNTFHEVIMTGLTWLYCCWTLQIDKHQALQTSDNCRWLLSHLETPEQPLSNYIQLYENIARSVTDCLPEESSQASHNARGIQQGDSMDWVNTRFSNEMLEASTAFDISRYDQIFWDLPELVEDDFNTALF